MKTWCAAEFDRAVRQLGPAGRIVHLGYVPHELLGDLYSASEFSVFASLWEGFGFPAVEAMACGSPLLTSNTTSLPEVTDGNAVLVDPASVQSIASGLINLHENPHLRAELKIRGIRRAAAFTWDQTARQTLKAYETIAPAHHV
jgi:glycosyltransferase involved in cell wall biosynthesis